MKQFRYWRDPLFLLGVSLYALNRWLILPHVDSPFLHGYFNDCLLIPCALPLLLWIQRELGLRTHDEFPQLGEIVFHLVIWSMLFEIIGPRYFPVTGDLRDILAYTAGGAIAWLWWQRTPLLRVVSR